MPATRTNPAPRASDALDQLRELLEADPRSIKEIALAGGLSPEHLYQVRSGFRRYPSIDTVAKILGALGLDWADLSTV